MDAPEVWWSPSMGEVLLPGLPNDPQSCSVYRDGWETIERPAEAVPLVPAEPVDEKGRGPSYWRGFVDGRVAERAGTPAAIVEFDTAGAREAVQRAQDLVQSIRGRQYPPVGSDETEGP